MSGFRWGGEAAIDFAIQYPAFVKSLTTIDSSLGNFPCPVDWDIHAKEQGLEKGKENWLNHEVFEATRKNSEALKQLKEMVDDYSGWKWVHADPRKKLEPSAMDQVKKVKVPTLILVGENDLEHFKDTAKYLHSNITNSKLTFIKNAGHMSNLENPDEVNSQIYEFLKTIK